MGSFLVIGTKFLVTLVSLSVAMWILCAWSAWRRTLTRALTVGGVALVLSVVTAADLVNAHYSYLPRLDDVLGRKTWPTSSFAAATSPIAYQRPTRPQGTVIDLPIAGTHSGFGTHIALVYLPPQYFADPTQRFPVVYLLHGTPGAPIDWFRADRAADVGLQLANSGRPSILVAPRMSGGWLDDSECVNRPTEHTETYLVDDVIPTIDGNLRTLRARSDRIFAGMSAGGYCALNLGLRHRDIVGGIVDLSGFSRPTHSGGMAGLFGGQPDLASVAASNNPSGYVHTMSGEPGVRLWLDSGRADHSALHDIVPMAAELRARDWPVVLRIRPGGHDYAVWRPALRDALAWIVPPARGTPAGAAPGLETSAVKS